MTMDSDSSESFEACRTCGIFFTKDSNFLKPIFPVEKTDIIFDILLELVQWNINIRENDGISQFLCISCIKTFNDLFTFRQNCFKVQAQLLSYSRLRAEDKIKIKTEKLDNEEDNCKIIYVDELSDTEFESPTPFDFAHIPIKEEPIEEATIPYEMELTGTSISPYRDLDNKVDNFDSLSSYKGLEENNVYENIKKGCIQDSSIENFSNNHFDNHRKNYKCRLCKKAFTGFNSQRIKFHLKWHMLRTRSNLQIHFSTHKIDNFKRRLPRRKYKKHSYIGRLNKYWPSAKGTDGFSTKNNRSGNIESIYEGSEQIDEETSDLFLIVCSKCDEKFQSANELQMHAVQHHKLNRSCVNDNMTTTSNKEDIEIIDSSKNRRQSDIDTSNPTNVENNAHINMIHTDEYNCFDHEINKMYADSSDSNSDNENEYFCAHCTSSFSNINDLRTHNEEHIKKIFQCNYCNKMFDLKFILNQHIQKMHQQ